MSLYNERTTTSVVGGLASIAGLWFKILTQILGKKPADLWWEADKKSKIHV